MSETNYPWVQLALNELGVREIPGKESNPRIDEYFAACGKTAEWALKQENTDSVPWCGAYIGFLMHECGLPLAPEPLRAKSWLEWGVEIKEPYPGSVAVLNRGNNPANGHVAIVHQVSADGRKLHLLGGNQGDSVSIQAFNVKDVVGYRLPPGFKVPGVKELTKNSRIAREASDLVKVGAGGTVAKIVESVTEPVKAVRDQAQDLFALQPLFEQALSFVQFVGRNVGVIVIAVAIFVALRILYYRYEDDRKGKTGDV